MEIHNRTAAGVPSGVSLDPEPHGEVNGPYEFFGASNSYIEFPSSAGGALDVRHSMTMLSWLYSYGQEGPIFNYRTGGAYGFHLWEVSRMSFVRINKGDYSVTTALKHTPLAGGWKFVGASYDSVSGDAKLWVDGVMVKALNIGAGLELATQDSIRMAVKINDQFRLMIRLMISKDWGAGMAQW